MLRVIAADGRQLSIKGTAQISSLELTPQEHSSEALRVRETAISPAN